ncbi:MAG: serine/threonine-protein kinase [Deltaproteobacteria bacterium]
MRRLGKYLLIERIASGGMAEVWRAEVTGPAGFVKQVAVKLVRADRGDDPEMVRMFLQEARLASCLHHANIVHVFDLEMVEGQYVIAMELVHGQSLRTVLDRCRGMNVRFGLPRAVRVAEQVARALAYAHRPTAEGGVAGLVHRDVSPHNILVSHEGEVKLTDFGIARVPGSGSLTGPGLLKGKLGYMAPEQASDAPVDVRADIFALGVVLWETCTGHPLFSRDTEVATLRALTGDEPVDRPSSWSEGVHPELDAIVMGALERDPARRTASAGEMAARLAEIELALSRAPEDRDLRPLMRKLWPDEVPSRPTPAPPAAGGAPSAALPEEPVTVTLPRPGRRRTALLLVVALLLLAAAGAGAFWRSGRRTPTPARAPEPVAAAAEPSPVPPQAAAQPAAAPVAETPALTVTIEPDPTPSIPAPPVATKAAPVRRASRPAPAAPRPGVLASADALEGLELPPVSSGEGILFVNAMPWAEIQLDGKAEGFTPREMRLAAGHHRLKLVHPSRGTVEREAEVRAGERLRVEVPLGP